MRRLFFATTPVIIAAAAFALGGVTLSAQEHEHQGMAAGCACCQKSGTDAKNHEADSCCAEMATAEQSAGGCCADMKDNRTATTAEPANCCAPAHATPPTTEN